MRIANNTVTLEEATEDTTPFMPFYPLAKDGLKEDSNEMLTQIGILTDIAKAFEATVGSIDELGKTYDSKLINAVMPRFSSMATSFGELPNHMNDRLLRLQRHRASLLTWEKLSQEEQIEQRDILVQLIKLWDLIYKTGLRASTPGFVQENFSSSLIAANIEDLKKNIEAEFTVLFEALIRPCYLASFLRIPPPQFLEQDFTLAKLWEIATPPWAGANVTGDYASNQHKKF